MAGRQLISSLVVIVKAFSPVLLIVVISSRILEIWLLINVLDLGLRLKTLARLDILKWMRRPLMTELLVYLWLVLWVKDLRIWIEQTVWWSICRCCEFRLINWNGLLFLSTLRFLDKRFYDEWNHRLVYLLQETLSHLFNSISHTYGVVGLILAHLWLVLVGFSFHIPDHAWVLHFFTLIWLVTLLDYASFFQNMFVFVIRIFQNTFLDFLGLLFVLLGNLFEVYLACINVLIVCGGIATFELVELFIIRNLIEWMQRSHRLISKPGWLLKFAHYSIILWLLFLPNHGIILM